jgi:nucleoside-triphosphatase THEP1
MKQLHMQLLPGAGVCGLLLHGMGGAGKSTLATMLARHLQQCGSFGGGVYKVAVQSEVKYTADTHTLQTAQHKLLALLSCKNELKPDTLDEGAQMLAEALKAKMEKGPVLLVVDNVPEGQGGILGLLPRNLESCLAEG